MSGTFVSHTGLKIFSYVQTHFLYDCSTLDIPRDYLFRVHAVIFILCTSHFRCRKNLYDNEEEYWVVLKETGKRKEEQSFEEIHKRQKKAIPHR